jgi:YVTN family beta-propeller protein
MILGALALPGDGGAARAPSTPASAATALPWGVPGLGPHRLVSTPLRAAGPASYLQSTPTWLAYDGATQSIYVAVPPSSVDIAPANSSASRIGLAGDINLTVPVGTDPFGVAYDAATGDIFVTNTGSNNVSVLFGNDSAPIASIDVGAGPMGVAYDPVNGYVYVADNGSSNVTVINATSLTVTATVLVGANPLGVAADPNSGAVFVADYSSDQVTMISSADHVVATQSVGGAPYGVAVDNLTGNIYVTNSESSNISVLSGANGSLVATISVWGDQFLQGVAYDPAEQLVWIGAGLNFMVVLSPANESVAGYEQFDPSGVAFDPASGGVCVTNTANATLECIVFLSGEVAGTATTVWENGLRAGISWSVTVSRAGWDLPSVTATTTSSSATIYSTGSIGASDFSVPAAGPYFPGPVYSNGTNSIAVNFSLIPGEYPVTFTASGFPLPGPGAPDWSVLLEGSLVSSGTAYATFGEPNGTYSFMVPPYDDNGTVGYPTPCAGSVTVTGVAVVSDIAFYASPTACGVVQFSESGLPTGTLWNVTLWNVTQNFYFNTVSEESSESLIEFSAPSGQYDFAVGAGSSYNWNPSLGTLTVTNGSFMGWTVNFTTTHPEYLVTFSETGLPSGSNWSVDLDGNFSSTSFTTLRYDEPNGTYSWSVGGLAGFNASPANGTVVVSGTATVVPVSFTPSGSGVYLLTFSESGLSTGSQWAVNLSGTTMVSTTSAIYAYELNGSYGYSVHGPAGYQATPSAGTAVVNGAAQTLAFAFSTGPNGAPYLVTLVESGLPNGTTWSANLGGLGGSTSTSAIAFSEPNGTYTLNVTPPANYSANYSSPVVVNGSSVSVGIGFSNSTYPITFLEVGLPTASLWTITATDAATHVVSSGQSTTSVVTLRLPDGTYSLSATGPSGYVVAFSSSSLTVHGASSVSPTATFTTQTGVTSTPPSVAIELITWVGLVIAVVAALAGAFGYTRYRSAQWRAEGQQWVEEIRTEGPAGENDDRGSG